MKPTIKIHIPEPCSQSWDEMKPETGGRHCTACAKTVVDFTRMTDAQILEVMRSSISSCGRFREDQVNRELVTPPAEKRFFLTPFYKIAASLLFVLSASKVMAQEKKTPMQQTDSAVRKRGGLSIRIAADTVHLNSETVLKAKEIEKMAVRDVADQVSTTAGGYSVQKGGGQLIIGGGRAENTVYIIDGVLQDGSGRRLKKWWQFWKRN